MRNHTPKKPMTEKLQEYYYFKCIQNDTLLKPSNLTTVRVIVYIYIDHFNFKGVFGTEFHKN